MISLLENNVKEVTNTNVLIPISLQSDGENYYFKLIFIV